MDDVFEKIIEIENRAKEVYEEAVKEKENMKEQLHQEMNEREKEIKEMSEGKIRQLILSGRQDVDTRVDRISQQIQEKLVQLDAQALKNAKKWEDKVFFNVIGD